MGWRDAYIWDRMMAQAEREHKRNGYPPTSDSAVIPVMVLVFWLVIAFASIKCLLGV